MRRYGKLSFVVRFVNDILLSAPSIVIGLFIYQLIVVPMGHFSAIAAPPLHGDRDPGGGAHHREYAAPGSQRLARGRLLPWARRKALSSSW